MFWVFFLCVCVCAGARGCACVYEGAALHILVYSSLLNIYQCRWAPCCMGKWNVKLSVAKTKHKELGEWVSGDNYLMFLGPIIAEIVFISLKNNTHTKKQIEKNVQLDCAFWLLRTYWNTMKAWGETEAAIGSDSHEEGLGMRCRFPSFWFASQDENTSFWNKTLY